GPIGRWMCLFFDVPESFQKFAQNPGGDYMNHGLVEWSVVWDHDPSYGSLVLPVGLKFRAKFGTVL
ncbi:hypothetical protein HAX54_011186, partial [Datura stramonium]|nr:hypothetical protein [Datura stramonium]